MLIQRLRRGMLTLGLLLVFLLVVPASGGADETTPNKNDIPKPVPVKLSLAGSDRPDILRFLNVRRAANPSLSPDGTQLAFTSTVTGKPQLWVISSDSGWPRQLTFGESVTFHRWSPAGNWLIYGTDRGGNEQEGYYLINPDGSREMELLPPADQFRVFGGFTRDGNRIAYSQSSGGDQPAFDVTIQDLATQQTRLVFKGRPGLYVQAWRPDGGAVILTEAVGENAANVYLFDVQAQKLTSLFCPEDPANYTSFSWTPDGRGFYLATNQQREFLNPAFYAIESGKLTYIKDERHDTPSVRLTNDGTVLAWVVNRQGYSELYAAAINPTKPTDISRKIAVPELPKGVYSLDWAADAHIAALTVNSPTIPGDIWTWDADAGTVRRATFSATAGLDMAEMVVPTHLSFKARDGVLVHGLFYRPRDTYKGGKPPLLLLVHGGPTAQARPVFRPEVQYLLTRGIAVFDLNYRGSTGYGKTFARRNDRRRRATEYLDMADAVAWLRKEGLVNTKKAAVMGGSYGGYLTMAALTRLPETFDAGVAFVGVSNWVTALEGASPQLKASDRYEYGDIDNPEDRAFFREISPITHVANVADPVMVLHGANDPRDPPTESDQFVRAIRAKGGEVEYLRFPDEGHGIRKLANRLIAYRRIANFLERHLKP